jgi:hypothetical protein
VLGMGFRSFTTWCLERADSDIRAGEVFSGGMVDGGIRWISCMVGRDDGQIDDTSMIHYILTYSNLNLLHEG